MLKIVLAGSPSIAISTFKIIIKHFNVVGIITQPDQKSGRGLLWKETPVAILAKQNKIKIFKPLKIDSIFQDLQALKYDLLLTFAYGQYIPTNILLLGKHLPLNIHGSLLPKYRGAAPIQHAILNNEKEIGISLIEMTKKMDAGNVFFMARAKINDFTTYNKAKEIISELASENIVNWLKKIECYKHQPRKQGDNFTLAPKIKKSDCEINEKEDSIFLACRKIKAYNETPGAFIFLKSKRIKIFDFNLEKIQNSIPIFLKDGVIYAVDFQREGKRRVQIIKK